MSERNVEIQEGCLAVVVKSRTGNIGKTLRVIKPIGKVYSFVGEDRWSVDRPMRCLFGPDVYHMRESALMRIDGLKEKEENKESETA